MSLFISALWAALKFLCKALWHELATIRTDPSYLSITINFTKNWSHTKNPL